MSEPAGPHPLDDAHRAVRPPGGSSAPIPPSPRPFQALVLGDDALVGGLFSALLTLAPPVHVLARGANIAESRAALTTLEYDLVFLGVRLSDGNGFDLVPWIRAETAVVFISDCDEHAARAFEVNAVDYLVPPLTVARLIQAMHRVAQLRPAGATKPAPVPGDSIFLRGPAAGGRYAAVTDIVAILSSENYSEVLLADGERWFVRRTMQAWQDTLPAATFARVRRTAIVNLEQIERVERTSDENTRLVLRGNGLTVPVGRRYWPHLRARLHQHQIG